jgi:CTP synthase
MRLGSYPQKLTEGSKAHQAYGSLLVHERHRHRFEFNNQFRQQFAAHGLEVTGTSPNGQLVEVIELRDHPWFLAVQCHPEFQSKPTKAHPLFRGFIQAALARHEGKKKDESAPRLRRETAAVLAKS